MKIYFFFSLKMFVLQTKKKLLFYIFKTQIIETKMREQIRNLRSFGWSLFINAMIEMCQFRICNCDSIYNSFVTKSQNFLSQLFLFFFCSVIDRYKMMFLQGKPDISKTLYKQVRLLNQFWNQISFETK